MAGIPVEMMVTRGVKSSARNVLDIGVKRTYKDSVEIANEDVPIEHKNNAVIAAIRQIVRLGCPGTIILSNGEIDTMLDRFQKEIHALYKASCSRTSASGPVNAAALAALINGESPADIYSFFSVYFHGNTTQCGDLNAAAAFNWSKAVSTAKFRHRAMSRSVLYNGTQNAIWQYIHGDSKMLIKPTKILRYPVHEQIKEVLGGNNAE